MPPDAIVSAEGEGHQTVRDISSKLGLKRPTSTKLSSPHQFAVAEPGQELSEVFQGSQGSGVSVRVSGLEFCNA